jgi:hypothetical protein
MPQAVIPAARMAPSPRARTSARPISPASLPAASVAPPPRQPEPSGPTHGDVFLDGARVGSWLSDRLAREAARPQFGATGIDPTIAPAWPGALQGH